jgi:GNAT superfamily N-acetyltransferase
VASLANRHIAAVLPGGAVPVAALLSQMERDTAEATIEPWVVDRHTLVGTEADRVVAAAHLKRYGADERTPQDYRDAAAIDWVICDPEHLQLGAALLEEAVQHLRPWDARVFYADGNLPCLGVYGIPDNWPHVQHLLAGAGFSDEHGQVEVVFAGELARVAPPGGPPLPGVEVRRVVGPSGTAFEGLLDHQPVGVFEVEDSYGTANAQLARWADEANHWVAPAYRGRGVGSWLFRHGCAWLRLGGKECLLAYAVERSGPGHEPGTLSAADWERYYSRHGLSRLARTRRGWTRTPD